MRIPTSDRKDLFLDEQGAGTGFLVDDSVKQKYNPISTTFIKCNTKRIKDIGVKSTSVERKMRELAADMYYDVDRLRNAVSISRSIEQFEEAVISKIKEIKKLDLDSSNEKLYVKILDELKKIQKNYSLTYVKYNYKNYWRFKVPTITLKNDNVEVTYDSIYVYIEILQNGRAYIWAKTDTCHPHIDGIKSLTPVCYGDLANDYNKASKSLDIYLLVEYTIAVLSCYNLNSCFYTLERAAGWRQCNYCGDYFDNSKNKDERSCPLHRNIK